MKKHIRHKRAVPKGTLRIHYTDPDTNETYAFERIKIKEFTRLVYILERAYGIKALNKEARSTLLTLGFTAAAQWALEQKELETKAISDAEQDSIMTNGRNEDEK